MDPPYVITSEIWEAFDDRLRSFVRKHVTDETDAEDILQETYLKIHKSLSSLKQEGRLTAWLFQIARNTIVDYYRQGKTTVDLPQELPDSGDEALSSDPVTEIASCIRPMVDKLPQSYRQAMLLTVYEGATQRGVAKKLGISLSGAKSRVQRARGKLNDMLLECCHFEFDRRGHIIDYLPKEAGCRFCPQQQADKR